MGVTFEIFQYTAFPTGTGPLQRVVLESYKYQSHTDNGQTCSDHLNVKCNVIAQYYSLVKCVCYYFI